MSPTTAPSQPLSHSGTATLLVLNPSEEVAKRIESHMRNAGHPVRAVWVTDLEDLEDVIRRSSPDLVLCTEGLAEASPEDVIALCTRVAPDLPVLLMGANRLSPANTVTALAAGARDLVAHSDLRHLHHLELVCLRELAAHYNLRELRATRARLADFEARHKQLLAGTGDAVVHVQEGIITSTNAAFNALLGYGDQESPKDDPLMDLVSPDHQSEVKQLLKQFAQGKARTDKPVELRLLHKNGQTLDLTAHVSVSQEGDDRLLELLIRAESAPAASGTTATVPPAAAAGGSGRLELFQALSLAAQVYGKQNPALLFLAVDSFDTIEERLGFQDSEQSVAQLSKLLKQRLNPDEPVYRFSTGELAIVTIRETPTEAETLIEVMRKDAAAHIFKTSGHEAHLSVTAVCYPLSREEKPDKVVSTVVSETRKLSRLGGNRIAVLGPTAQAAHAEQEEHRRAEQIKKALQENRMKLAYQSIASLEGSSRQHFDVLARMLDETGKEVPARDFIPAAEKYGLIVAIDRWVIAKSLKVLAKREGAKDNSSLFVRISEQTLRESEAFYKWLAEQLKARALQKDELVIQLREPHVHAHIGKAKALCKALKGLGAGIAVDYFGESNNSSLILEHIPASFIRFHSSFTKNFNEPAMQKKMAELMELAKQRNIKTIVAHVEDANVMARLWQLGVNYIQGYHIQEPEVVLLATDIPR
jgi:multidomain signaling protein FimX